MIKLCTAFTALGLAAAIPAQPAQLDISIGVRETGSAGGYFYGIGSDGGTSGGIEWINLDGQQLTLDGTWQLFVFDLANDPITGFAGTSANSILEGTYGVLEHIRVRNSGNVIDPINLFVDDVTNTTNTGGAVNFGDFEGFGSGDEVMFQEPSFSGSTSTNVVAGGTSGVDNLVASRTSSCRFDFQFVDPIGTRWVRLTTFRATNIPNPLVRFDDGSIISFWMRGGECQPDLGSQGPGTSISEICGSGLAAGESSTYYTAGSPLNAPGAIFVSLPNTPDFPIFGGNLVSGTGVLGSISIVADGSGRFATPLPGVSSVQDLVMQSVFFDFSTPFGLAFTNAIEAKFGQ